jgi:hypothetical protein
VGDTDRCYAGLGLGDGAAGGVAAATTARAEEYEEVLGRLSSLISQKVRAHTGNRGNQWELLERYIQVRCPLLTLLRPSPLLNPVGMYCLIRADLAVTVRADSGAGGAHRADEGDPCRGDQREGKITSYPNQKFREYPMLRGFLLFCDVATLSISSGALV